MLFINYKSSSFTNKRHIILHLLLVWCTIWEYK